MNIDSSCLDKRLRKDWDDLSHECLSCFFLIFMFFFMWESGTFIKSSLGDNSMRSKLRRANFSAVASCITMIERFRVSQRWRVVVETNIPRVIRLCHVPLSHLPYIGRWYVRKMYIIRGGHIIRRYMNSGSYEKKRIPSRVELIKELSNWPKRIETYQKLGLIIIYSLNSVDLHYK